MAWGDFQPGDPVCLHVRGIPYMGRVTRVVGHVCDVLVDDYGWTYRLSDIYLAKPYPEKENYGYPHLTDDRRRAAAEGQE